MPDHPLAYAEIDVKRCTKLKGLVGCHTPGPLSLRQGCWVGLCPYIHSVVVLTLYSVLRIQTAPPILAHILHRPPRPRAPRKHILNINRGRLMYRPGQISRIIIQATATALSSASLYPSHSSHSHLLSFSPYPVFTSHSYTTTTATS
jgi:hypothetical protein